MPLYEYIILKKYNTSYGDLVPVIMANALMINILLVIQNGTACGVQLLSPRCHVEKQQRTIRLYKKGEHYDAILLVDEQNIEINMPSTNNQAITAPQAQTHYYVSQNKVMLYGKLVRRSAMTHITN